MIKSIAWESAQRQGEMGEEGQTNQGDVGRMAIMVSRKGQGGPTVGQIVLYLVGMTNNMLEAEAGMLKAWTNGTLVGRKQKCGKWMRCGRG